MNKFNFFRRLRYTLKKFSVDPPATKPYLILVCKLRSLMLLIGLLSLETVKKAAKFAV